LGKCRQGGYDRCGTHYRQWADGPHVTPGIVSPPQCSNYGSLGLGGQSTFEHQRDGACSVPKHTPFR
jgi:hypothetical protein